MPTLAGLRQPKQPSLYPLSRHKLAQGPQHLFFLENGGEALAIVDGLVQLDFQPQQIKTIGRN